MLPTLLLLLACGSSPEAHDHGHDHAHDGDDATTHHRFDDPEKWSEVFDDPERDAWQKPAAVVQALTLEPGMTVADIGAGTGYFNPHLAKAVGPEGTVIAVDIEPKLVEHMTARAVEEDTPQVKPRLGKADDPGLKPAEADRVLIVDTYHHIDDRLAYFGDLAETLKPGGHLVVVDFKPGELPVGPGPAHKLAPEKVKAELAEAGWSLVAETDALPYQFLFDLVPKAAE